MKNSTRKAKQAAKAKLSGAISSNSPTNKKIVFGDDNDDNNDNDGDDKSADGEVETQQKSDTVENDDGGATNEDGTNKDENVGSENRDDDDDDAVEEVKGSAARESTQRIRDEERKIAKESLPKKKRRKKHDDDDAAAAPPAAGDAGDDSEEDDEEDDEELLTEDFFKMVDSERADQLHKAKKEKKIKKVQEKKRMGKHTTFVAEDEYKMTDEPHKTDQNIEVVALGIGDSNGDGTTADDPAAMEERQLLLSATLGTAPSKSAVFFARGSMARGTLKDRGSDSRKRKSKDEETWKRSRKLNTLGGSRPGRAAALFVRRR